MIELKLGEIRNMKEPLQRLLDKEIPVRVAWNLTKLVKVFDKELSELEEQRVDTIKRIGVVDDSGNMSVPDDKMEEFVQTFNESLNSDFVIEDFEPIPVDLLGDITISAKDMIFLEKLIRMD